MSKIKTTQAVMSLGTTYHRLFSLIRYGKIRRPEKDSSGDYLWGSDDLEAARYALRTDGRRKAQPAEGVASVG
jgi:hypothetical protein